MFPFDDFFFPFQNYLRVIYKGYGKTPKDASSVRATHFIPASCGLYYYEVKIISKGRDGYMGIGLSMQQVSTNRLPGWDKLSYGYHGDDGNAFCGSGTGQVSSSLSNNPGILRILVFIKKFVKLKGDLQTFTIFFIFCDFRRIFNFV